MLRFSLYWFGDWFRAFVHGPSWHSTFAEPAPQVGLRVRHRQLGVRPNSVNMEFEMAHKWRCGGLALTFDDSGHVVLGLVRTMIPHGRGFRG